MSTDRSAQVPRHNALVALWRVLVQIQRLLAVCCGTREGKFGLVLLLAVLGLKLVSIPVTVRLVAWSADFFNALQKLDVQAATYQIGVFAVLTAIGAAAYLAASYLRKLLLIRWRRVLTDALLGQWLGERRFWHMSQAGSPVAVDNPDQRIADDCFIFLERTLGEDGNRGNALDFAVSIVALVSYVVLLWQVADYTLRFDVFGVAVEIPRYMVWAAPAYVALSTALTQWLGAPLKGLMFEQQRREGDFRFALARLREEAEPVALAGGESAERAILDRRFDALAGNWRRLIRRELILGAFTRPYFMTVLRIPMFLALPAFLAGKVTLGGLMQTASAFSNVVTTLSWFIFSYRDLAELAATSSRLDGFRRAMDGAPPASGIAVLPSPSGHLAWSGLRLRRPDGSAMLDIPDASFPPGAPIWIEAPSGTGKSTLIRAVAGLWGWGEGRVERPAGRLRFFAQRSYFPLGTLEEAAAYPGDVLRTSATKIGEALEAVALPAGAASRFSAEHGDRGSGLSGGERQRLHLASLLLDEPDWVFLDETTSGLDSDAEADLLGILRVRLPRTTFVIVSHRRPGVADLRRLTLGGA